MMPNNRLERGSLRQRFADSARPQARRWALQGPGNVGANALPPVNRNVSRQNAVYLTYMYIVHIVYMCASNTIPQKPQVT